MNVHDIAQPETLGAVHTLIPPLKRQNTPTVYVVVSRPPANGHAKMPTRYRETMVAVNTIADDITEATWEDAEWQ